MAAGDYWASLEAHWSRICLQHGRPGFDPWVGKNPLEKGKATPSSILAWRVPWTVHGVAKSRTRWSDFHCSSSNFPASYKGEKHGGGQWKEHGLGVILGRSANFLNVNFVLELLISFLMVHILMLIYDLKKNVFVLSMQHVGS